MQTSYSTVDPLSVVLAAERHVELTFLVRVLVFPVVDWCPAHRAWTVTFSFK